MPKNTHKSSADLTQELLVMRMDIEAMRGQFLAHLDTILARIDQVLPPPAPDPRLMNPSKIDWRKITEAW